MYASLLTLTMSLGERSIDRTLVDNLCALAKAELRYDPKRRLRSAQKLQHTHDMISNSSRRQQDARG